MNRRDLIIATLATAGENASFAPVQIQKIFFLVDRKAVFADGPHFHFVPYDYGPFDSSVYDELDFLNHQGLVEIDSGGRYRKYSLTARGIEAGNNTLSSLTADIQSFLQDTVAWVRALRFDQLVSAIYREYPDMKVNSIFKS